MIKEVEFPSEGATLRGLLFLPETPPSKLPLVIMAHGTSATMFMVADKYAQAFCRAGLAARWASQEALVYGDDYGSGSHSPRSC